MFINILTYAFVSIYINVPVVHLWCLAEFLNTKVYTIIIITSIIIIFHIIITKTDSPFADCNFVITV
jgi:hypothetical protein